jgi:hypothetical protein
MCSRSTVRWPDSVQFARHRPLGAQWYIAYYDSWDGAHPRVFSPKNKPYVEFESSEHINNYLLRDAEVGAYLKRRGGTPMVAMVFFDEETGGDLPRTGLQADSAARFPTAAA